VGTSLLCDWEIPRDGGLIAKRDREFILEFNG
jgi:hypothetical protein